jgi:hypothetical protein
VLVLVRIIVRNILNIGAGSRAQCSSFTTGSLWRCFVDSRSHRPLRWSVKMTSIVRGLKAYLGSRRSGMTHSTLSSVQFVQGELWAMALHRTFLLWHVRHALVDLFLLDCSRRGVILSKVSVICDQSTNIHFFNCSLRISYILMYASSTQK